MKCADCTTEFTARRANAKYCDSCRIYRSIQFHKDNLVKCWSCDTKFAPIARGDKFCGPCLVSGPGDEHGDCALCGNKSRLIRPSVPVCVACATSPEQRPLFARALAKGRKARQAGA